MHVPDPAAEYDTDHESEPVAKGDVEEAAEESVFLQRPAKHNLHKCVNLLIFYSKHHVNQKVKERIDFIKVCCYLKTQYVYFNCMEVVLVKSYIAFLLDNVVSLTSK